MTKIAFTIEPGTLVSTLAGQSEDRHEKHHLFKVHKDDGGEYVKVKTMVEPFRITQIHRGRLHMVLKTSGGGSGDPPPRPESETPTDARTPTRPETEPAGGSFAVVDGGPAVLRFYFPDQERIVSFIMDLLHRNYSPLGHVPLKGFYVHIPVFGYTRRMFSISEVIDPGLEYLPIDTPVLYAWAVSCLHPVNIERP